MRDPLDQLRLRFAGLRLVTETDHTQVYAGEDFTGAEVTVAVLTERAAADPAVRGAFADVVGRHRSGPAPGRPEVYAADPLADRPWAAVRSRPGAPGAEALLAAAPVAADPAGHPAAGATAGPGAGPAGGQDAVPADAEPPAWPLTPPELAPLTPPELAPPTPPELAPPAPSGRGKGTAAAIAAVAGILAAAALGAVIAFGQILGSGGSTGAAPAPEAEPDEPAPAGAVHPPTGPDGPDGPVAGPTFGDGEPTRVIPLSREADFPFNLRTPPGWGCREGDANPGTLRQVCIYDGGGFPRVRGGPGGIIEVAPCPEPCGEPERDEIRTMFPDPESPWQEIDEQTWYAQTEVHQTDAGPRLRAYLSRVFTSEPGGSLVTHVTVRFAGHPDELPILQKIINDLYAATA